ncbi:MAG: signal peptidase I [Candidatus Moraniibacteriota bacterium]
MPNTATDKLFTIGTYFFYAVIVVIAIFLLATKLPIAGGLKTYVVQSGSMEPAIKTGSVIVAKPANEYRVGDVVTFGAQTKDKTPTTHRIVEVRDGKYMTRGDANNAEDLRPVSRFEIIGKVLFSVPFIGYGVAAAQKPWGFGLIIVIPAVLIIYEEVQKIRQELKKKADYKRRVEKRTENATPTDEKTEAQKA